MPRRETRPATDGGSPPRRAVRPGSTRIASSCALPRARVRDRSAAQSSVAHRAMRELADADAVLAKQGAALRAAVFGLLPGHIGYLIAWTQMRRGIAVAIE